MYPTRKAQFEDFLAEFMRESKKDGFTIHATMRRRLEKLLKSVAMCAAAEERQRILKMNLEGANQDEIKKRIVQNSVEQILGY